MEVHLRPEQELYIQSQVRQGRFATPDEALQAAMTLLDKEEGVLSQMKSENGEKRESFGQFLLRSPLAGSGLKTERSRDQPRPASFD